MGLHRGGQEAGPARALSKHQAGGASPTGRHVLPSLGPTHPHPGGRPCRPPLTPRAFAGTSQGHRGCRPPTPQALSRGRRANPVTSCLRLGSGQLPQWQYSRKGKCTQRRERGRWGSHGGWRPGDSVMSPWGRLGQGTERCSQSRCHALEGPALGMGLLRASPRCRMGSGPYAHAGARGLAGWGARLRRLGHNLNGPVGASG